MFSENNKDDTTETKQLIFHMRDTSWRNLKSKSKFRAFLGPESVCEVKNDV